MSYRRIPGASDPFAMLHLCDGCGRELVPDEPPVEVHVHGTRADGVTNAMDLCRPCVAREQRAGTLLGRFLSDTPHADPLVPS